VNRLENGLFKMKWIKSKFEKFTKSTKLGIWFKKYSGWDDGFALFFFIVGLIPYIFPSQFINPRGIFHFLQNVHVEFIGIGITVLIIGNAGEYSRNKLEERRKNVELLKSSNPELSLNAVDYLSDKGYLYDGTTSGASLQLANLPGVNFDYADMRRTNFNNAIISGSSLVNSNFSDANLTGSILTNSILKNADLSGTVLQNANLEGADLSSAILYGADLRDAKLDSAVITDAKYDKSTLWPEKYQPEEHGAIIVE